MKLAHAVTDHGEDNKRALSIRAHTVVLFGMVDWCSSENVLSAGFASLQKLPGWFGLMNLSPVHGRGSWLVLLLHPLPTMNAHPFWMSEQDICSMKRQSGSANSKPG